MEIIEESFFEQSFAKKNWLHLKRGEPTKLQSELNSFIFLNQTPMIRVTLFDFLMLFDNRKGLFLTLFFFTKVIKFGHNFYEIINQYLYNQVKEGVLIASIAIPSLKNSIIIIVFTQLKGVILNL